MSYFQVLSEEEWAVEMSGYGKLLWEALIGNMFESTFDLENTQYFQFKE